MSADKVSSVAIAGYEEESRTKRLSRKAKDSPFMVAGLVGLSGIVAFSFYGLRQRKLPMSLYLIQTRVVAQGFVVTCLTAGIGYSLFRDYVYPKLVNKTSSSTSGSNEEK